ncbi:MAG: hypothetical protein A2568_02695 [Candidatus Yanofskybacteria bacterium RIFOXYD1_FULL_44_17]|uniref:Uncharacterized protein n=1 Tax=Candidatus Yanofskybacteria bacterium GW2011_GWE2_40_11 TaxID=1619033 RepID=A0A0G0QLA6_9BACT|nr:MAG: hypothetical protein UT69_C0019G0005 [Candidatus Yanofskybacteria bacterium GW2011_GWE1_40_10]KKR40923.1 MAG: hypothetical protein UT75_C0003G0053 [Candidatus Yanofskybacteria bacterium GW2011_GWE2_40_11]KKT15404.1 MAG: hypothetical protein UV97_C0007G0014 [Candidatus Yanofskybacteria bacterium GW2011_GWF2_43_596]OGN35380.1 MAG: hypothetical protein A2207_00095 [Candidatus Yanofskybacteria bacterium RIFOXYA1_FULL_44_17]OGN36530.1 MAG: hypothetical protein A2241_02210 [Candidatus Yanofsk
MPREIIATLLIAIIGLIGTLLITFSYDPYQSTAAIRILFLLALSITIWASTFIFLSAIARMLIESKYDSWLSLVQSLFITLGVITFFSLNILKIYTNVYFGVAAIILITIYALAVRVHNKNKYYNFA